MHLVKMCRSIGVITPEDLFPVWEGPGGPVTIAPLFLLYDYTFRPTRVLRCPELAQCCGTERPDGLR